MTKLMTWERNIQRLNPKVSPVVRAISVKPLACARIAVFMFKGSMRPNAGARLLHEEQSVEHDRFRQSNRENRLHQNGSRRSWIAANRRSRAHTDQTDTDGRAECRQPHVNASGDFRQHWY